MIEPPIKELRGKSRLALGFFNSLIRRIECTKPVVNTGKTLTQLPDGIDVGSGFTKYTLNVCSNGTPSTITVYGP